MRYNCGARDYLLRRRQYLLANRHVSHSVNFGLFRTHLAEIGNESTEREQTLPN